MSRPAKKAHTSADDAAASGGGAGGGAGAGAGVGAGAGAGAGSGARDEFGLRSDARTDIDGVLSRLIMERVGPSGFVDLDIWTTTGRLDDEVQTHYMLRKVWDLRGPRIDLYEFMNFTSEPPVSFSILEWKSLREREMEGWVLLSREQSELQLMRVLKTFNMGSSGMLGDWLVEKVLSIYHEPEAEQGVQAELRVFDLPPTTLTIRKTYPFGANRHVGERLAFTADFNEELQGTKSTLELRKRKHEAAYTKQYVDSCIERLRGLARVWIAATIGAGQT
jgi:hypothetical protein